MIELKRFQDCFLEYLKEFLIAEKNFIEKRDNLIKACSGLICHPDISDCRKKEMMELQARLISGLSP